MNPESLLHEAAELLRAEAKNGPGTMFLLMIGKELSVTRTPGPDSGPQIIRKFDCQKFSAGLSSREWALLMKHIWSAKKVGP